MVTEADMKESLVIAASSDRHEVERIFHLLKRRGIAAEIETRTVYVGGDSAEGYRLRVPPEAITRARQALGEHGTATRGSGKGFVDHPMEQSREPRRFD